MKHAPSPRGKRPQASSIAIEQVRAPSQRPHPGGSDLTQLLILNKPQDLPVPLSSPHQTHDTYSKGKPWVTSLDPADKQFSGLYSELRGEDLYLRAIQILRTVIRFNSFIPTRSLLEGSLLHSVVNWWGGSDLEGGPQSWN